MSPTATATPDALATELRERLADAVRAEGRSATVLLTGDVESSLLCALAADEGLLAATVTVALDQAGLELARVVSHRYSVAHQELLVPEDLAELMPRLAHATREPPRDPLALQRLLAGELADGTLLTATGAAEFLGGSRAWWRRDEGRSTPQEIVLAVDEQMPYLHPRVMEFARSLDPRYKARGLTSKLLLRRAALPVLPGALVHAPDRSARAQRSFVRQVSANRELWSQ